MSKKPVYIDQFCYELMLSGLNDQSLTDLNGAHIDLALFYDDQWLMDSAVVENVVYNKGHWDIYLVFVDPLHPLKLIRRKISSYFTEKKALQAGNYMRRLAAKDQRGTIKVDISNHKPLSDN
tara:strand:- start:198 stop:563 length:366 start_codon:yes stop_codon:yes gene_type:complete